MAGRGRDPVRPDASAGTYTGHDDVDIDALNAQFLAAMVGQPWDVVWSQANAGRTVMLQAWRRLTTPDDEAAWWIRKSAVDHYADHLGRLRVWVEELVALRTGLGPRGAAGVRAAAVVPQPASPSRHDVYTGGQSSAVGRTPSKRVLDAELEQRVAVVDAERPARRDPRPDVRIGHEPGAATQGGFRSARPGQQYDESKQM